MQQDNEEKSSQELNPWLQRLADRALPFAAQSTVLASVPHLSSYTRQQLGQADEANSQLARRVADHSRLASVISRAIHLPLLSRAFDSIWRKPTFMPSVWQRMLDLPWFRQHRERRRSSTTTTGTAPEGKLTNTISLQSERYPNTLIQAIRDTEEERLDGEADGTYSLPAHDIFSPPIIGRGRLTVVDGLPHAAPTETLPVQTKKTAATHPSNALTQRLRAIGESQPVYTMDEAYPAVIQNLFPSPAAGGERPPDTYYGLPHHARATPVTLMTKQIAVNLENQATDSLTSSLVSQSGIVMPGLAKPSDIQRSEPRLVKDAQERLAKVSRQPYYSYPDQSLPRHLTTVTQQTMLQRRPVEVLSQTIREDLGEGQSSPAGALYYPKAIDSERKSSGVTAKQAASPFIASMPGESPKITGQSVIPVMADRLGGLLSNLPPTRRVTLGEGSKVLPHRVAPQRAIDVSQTQTGAPLISRQEVEATHKPDVPNPFTEARVSVDQGFTEGYAEKPLYYKETSSVSRSAIQPLPFMESISRKITLPSQQLFKSAANVPPSYESENFRFLGNREYAPSSLSYKDANQPALELPIAHPARPQADSSIARSEEVFRYTSFNIPELAHSRNNGVPQLALAPIGGATETNEPPQVTTPELGGEEIGEQGATPDIRALAREIYPLIKRMIMVERERRPT
jgi:hypothetical protein